ncbi:MAG TPA: hypothetical protein VMP08_26740 [Anaerolineae bacterium]|nr:hypothetical protein [Anaerolineae bacterium]
MIEFKPSLKRYFFLWMPFDLLVGLCAIAVGVAVTGSFTLEKWSPYAIGWIIGSLAGSLIFFNSQVIMLNDQEIKGRSKWGISQITLPLIRVDVARSRRSKTALYHWLFGRYEIYSADGRMIGVNRLMFGQKRFNQLLDVITTKQQEAIENHLPLGSKLLAMK